MDGGKAIQMFFPEDHADKNVVIFKMSSAGKVKQV
jgi:hypothetical protein